MIASDESLIESDGFASSRSPRARLVLALEAAALANRGVPADLEAQVREFAKGERLGGASVASVLVDVKKLLREHTGRDVVIFEPKVIGWTIAGYFAGTPHK